MDDVDNLCALRSVELGKAEYFLACVPLSHSWRGGSELTATTCEMVSLYIVEGLEISHLILRPDLFLIFLMLLLDLWIDLLLNLLSHLLVAYFLDVVLKGERKLRLPRPPPAYFLCIFLMGRKRFFQLPLLLEYLSKSSMK
jgi:hypothetical protein